MKTTLNKIREYSPCSQGWAILLKNIGKKQADDEPLPITTILDSNGVDDALWCLRAVAGHQREMRLYAVACARSVQHMTADMRSINAIDTAERYACGLATDDELAATRIATRIAAEDSVASDSAARAAALASSARDAACASAMAAAWSSSARDTAWAAARDAARNAAWASAWDAASRATLRATPLPSVVRVAAYTSARGRQADLLRLMCTEIGQ